ncbi:uncharacterized protein LOC107369753 isoform X19 [Tetranychus urticae]|uniref:uncharacterized protein LOC107369753 isoform X19 n=1 Tax=Tetranychus urticae TaxID=32264 RepID=UPI00077BF03A|nr:uncharacterized protein LOC107369753 isoform X19 [Tetranychus urticae]
MLINEIPDDCLLAIFDYMVNLDHLINCYKVCVKWSNLITKRTKKVKYLIDHRNDSSDVFYYLGFYWIDSFYLSKLFTNLKIVELSPEIHLKAKHAIEFVRKQESLKGLINRFDEPIEKYCDKLEMLSVNTINPNNLRNSSRIKQLDIWSYSLKALERDAHYLPNLERLKMQIKGPDYFYDGPILKKLKILELSFFTSSPHYFFNGFLLMELCPNLQSAHIFIRADTWLLNEPSKHECLRDLVIQLDGYEGS